MLNLSEAAKVSGQPKSAIWRAVNSGQLPATRTFAGDYRIDPAELHRVFPPGAELATDVSPIVSLKRDPTELQRAEAAARCRSRSKGCSRLAGRSAKNSMTPQRLVPRRSPPRRARFVTMAKQCLAFPDINEWERKFLDSLIRGNEMMGGPPEQLSLRQAERLLDPR